MTRKLLYRTIRIDYKYDENEIDEARAETIVSNLAIEHLREIVGLSTGDIDITSVTDF